LALVDGGKMSRRTRKAVLALINEKYVFKNFNILIYAENYIFPLASLATQPSVADSTAEATENSEDVEGDAEKVTDKKQISKKDEEKEASRAPTSEENRELLYDLYYKALKLEPEPKHPEMTYSQIQLMNKARKFVTLKMKKRQEMAANKRSKKDKIKMRKLLSKQLIE